MQRSDKTGGLIVSYYHSKVLLLYNGKGRVILKIQHKATSDGFVTTRINLAGRTVASLKQLIRHKTFRASRRRGKKIESGIRQRKRFISRVLMARAEKRMSWVIMLVTENGQHTPILRCYSRLPITYNKSSMFIPTKIRNGKADGA